MDDTTEDQAAKELKELQQLVRRFLPIQYDRDSLVQDLWIEVHARHCPITPHFVKCRCIDIMRAEGRHNGHRKRYKPAESTLPSSNDIEHLDQTLSHCDLSPMEQQLIFHYFYQSLNQQQTAQRLGISTPAVSLGLRRAIEKIRYAYMQTL